MPSKQIAVVTGANGFVGSHLVAALAEQQYHVRCIVRSSSNIKWLEKLDVEIIRCGLQDKTALKKAFENARFIFHVAGTTKEKKYDSYHYGNVQLTENVLQACENIPSIQKIVITSSLAAAAASLLNQPINEETPSYPISKYGKSKLAMEQMLHQKYKHLPYSIVRPPAVYGARDTEILTFFAMVNKGLATQVGLKTKQISMVYIDDLIQGLILAATKDIATHQTYFITSDEILTYEELIQAVAQALDKQPLKIPIPHFLLHGIAGVLEFITIFQQKVPPLNREKAKEMTQEAWICTSEKARKELGYQAQTFIQEGTKKTVNWYKKAAWLK